MTLPRRLLLRIRRKLRRRRPTHRRQSLPFPRHSRAPAQPKPPDRMKTAFLTLLLFILALGVFALAGCSTVTVRTITTDKGGTVTDVTSTTRGTDPAALQLAGSIASVYLPQRARLVRQEKSSSRLRTILRGRPITRQEIAARWQPAP